MKAIATEEDIKAADSEYYWDDYDQETSDADE